MLSYFVKFGLSTAIVCMRGTTANATEESDAIEVSMKVFLLTKLSYENKFQGELTWTDGESAYALGALNIGNSISPMIGGWLAFRIGPKRTILLSLGNLGLTCLLLPVMAR